MKGEGNERQRSCQHRVDDQTKGIRDKSCGRDGLKCQHLSRQTLSDPTAWLPGGCRDKGSGRIVESLPTFRAG